MEEGSLKHLCLRTNLRRGYSTAENPCEPKLRAVFPNLAYEAWEGSGHFLMMESPDRFNRALEQFLAQQNKHSNAAIR